MLAAIVLMVIGMSWIPIGAERDSMAQLLAGAAVCFGGIALSVPLIPV